MRMIEVLTKNDIKKIIDKRLEPLNKKIDSRIHELNQLTLKMNDLEIIIKKRLKKG